MFGKIEVIRLSGNKLKVLNGMHVIFLTQNIMFGAGVLSLPEMLSSLGYSQSWMPILFGIIACLTLWPMIWICSKYENDNLFRINEKLLGKWFGKSMNVFIILVYTIFLSSVISNYMELIQTTALSQQTITVPLLLFLLLLVYISSGGIKSIARFCIMAFFITISMVYFLKWSIEKGDVKHLLPLFNFNTKELLVGLREGYNSMLGYELILIYFPYIINQKKAFKYAVIGIWISVSLYLLTTVVSVMYFSEWQLTNVEYSVLHLFKAGELNFIERIDIFGITFWVFVILTTAAGYLWSAKKGLDSIFKKEKKYHLYALAVVVFVVVMLPFSQEFQASFFKYSYYATYALVGWPIFLSIVYKHRIKRVQQ